MIKKYKHLFAKTPVGIQTQAGPHYIVTFKSVGESDLVLQLPRVAANDCDVFNYHSDGSSVSCLSLGNPEKLTFK